MPSSDLVLFQNLGLSDADTGGQTSSVGEPSLANNGQQIFMTGNWYATRSLDNGASWAFISPFNLLPPANGGFCCDQTALYDPSRDLVFWLLQYIEQGGTNTLRVAVKRGPTLGNNDWYWWDFRPVTVNANWQNQWFDYNHAALSNNYLYVASNVFSTTNDVWTRSVILRLPLDSLADGSQLSYTYFQSTSNFSLRCALGARDVMYFGSHNSNRQIRVFAWPENVATISQRDIDVSPWQAGDYTATGPDGHNWLSRCDPRITGAWVADGVIGFMWSANKVGTSRPFPYVRVVRLEEDSKAVIDEPDLWNAEYAFAYPDACPNDRGHIGIALFRGGGNRHPGHVVGIWDDYANGWSLLSTRDGTNGPADEKWGDYLACRRHAPDGLTWIATGFTLQGGSSRTDIEPRIVHFGRKRDEGAVNRWRNA
jgi:hypothetical protein